MTDPLGDLPQFADRPIATVDPSLIPRALMLYMVRGLMPLPPENRGHAPLPTPQEFEETLQAEFGLTKDAAFALETRLHAFFNTLETTPELRDVFGFPVVDTETIQDDALRFIGRSRLVPGRNPNYPRGLFDGQQLLDIARPPNFLQSLMRQTNGLVHNHKPAVRLVRNYGLVLAALAVVSYYPYTGFFLTILTLGRLPSLVCNAFLIHLSITSLRGTIARAWLGIPIICYGAWLGWLIWQRTDTYLTTEKLEAENSISEPVEQDVTLVFSQSDSELSKRAFNFLAPPVRIFSGTAESGPDYIPPNSPPLKEWLYFRQLEAPNPDSGGGAYLYRYELVRNSATNEQRVIGHFNFGRLSRPSLAPIFFAGCGLIDNPPAWRCEITPFPDFVPIGQIGDELYNYDPGHYDPFHTKADPVIRTLAKMLGVVYLRNPCPRGCNNDFCCPPAQRPPVK
ncbi:MAG: hypothetical protein ACLQB4_07690 [Beijerinckiaceae bacterium]